MLFDSNTNTVVSTVQDSGYIKSLYITTLHPLQKWSTTWSTISRIMRSCREKTINLPDNHLEKIISCAMNNDETQFLCTFFNHVRDKKIFLIDIAQGAATLITQAPAHFLIPTNNALFSLSKALGSDYRLSNNVTNNEWVFTGKLMCKNEILLHNKQQIIRVEKEDYKRNLSKTILINCVDDVMTRFVQNISAGQLPLVVYTITSTPPGRIALNEYEYEEYENVPQTCRLMIDSLYVVTKKNIVSQSMGILRSIHRTVFPYIKIAGSWILCQIPMIIIPICLHILIPRISDKEFSNVLQSFLKM